MVEEVVFLCFVVDFLSVCMFFLFFCCFFLVCFFFFFFFFFCLFVCFLFFSKAFSDGRKHSLTSYVVQ